MTRYLSGDKLTPKARQEVLNAYGYRWTIENLERAKQWYGHKGNWPKMAPVSDYVWLKQHAFAVRKDGGLDSRARSCRASYLYP